MKYYLNLNDEVVGEYTDTCEAVGKVQACKMFATKLNDLLGFKCFNWKDLLSYVSTSYNFFYSYV